MTLSYMLNCIQLCIQTQFDGILLFFSSFMIPNIALGLLNNYESHVPNQYRNIIHHQDQ